MIAYCNTPTQNRRHNPKRMRTKAPGDRLREAREAAKISAAELSEATGVPKDTIIAWERIPTRLNPSKPRHVESIANIARVLGVEEGLIWGVAVNQVRESRAEYGGDVMQDVAQFLLDIAFKQPELPDDVREEARDLLKRVIVTKSA